MKTKMHPNSLANLDPEKSWKDNSEVARMAQKKSVEARLANKKAREALALTAAELKLDVEELMAQQNLSALDILRLSMIKAIQREDYDTAADLATRIAPYEAPKLQAIEQTNKEVATSDLSDEELAAKIKALLGDK